MLAPIRPTVLPAKGWSGRRESQSTGTLSREGWRPGSFKPGDKVTLKIFPMKDGSAGGTFVGAVLANGQTLGRMTP